MTASPLEAPCSGLGHSPGERTLRNCIRGVLFVVALLLIAVFLGRSGDIEAAYQATAPVNVAGVVVDYGDGRVSYAIVPFTEVAISGVELLRRSGFSLLSVEFGAMGEGICAIEETGCDLSACRARLCQTGDPNSPFWHYVRDGGDGQWQSAPLGASASVIGNGDVDGWFWTGAAPDTDVVTLDVIASQTGVDLETYASPAAVNLEPVVVTTGGSNGDDAVDDGDILAGIAIVAGVAALGGFLIVRSRRRRPS